MLKKQRSLYGGLCFFHIFVRMKNIFIALSIAMVAVACGSANNNNYRQLTVTIAPLGWIVEHLTDSATAINVIVPPGTSPETYEPTARQIEDLNRAQIVFSIGLIDFEKQIEARLRQVAPKAVYVRLADSLDLITSSCDHHHQEAEHNHGAADPHVWLSPKMMRRMAQITAHQIIEQKIDTKENVDLRLEKLLATIDSTDETIRANIAQSENKTFAIVHPSLGYFAADYGLKQVSIEVQGKEPSGSRIKALVDTLRANNIRTIIHSTQDPATAARVIATEIGGVTATFDPMQRDWARGMVEISETICKRD